MARISSVAVVVAILIIALGAVQLLRPAAAGDTILMSPTFHAASCPQLESIVRSSVQAALQKEIAIAAGLLRIFFHDCFPQGCDASVFLKGADSEQAMGPNLTLQPLVSGQGVFTSDVALIKDPNTARIVKQFAESKDAFFAQFSKSMVKLSNAPRPAGNVGEIRRSCFSRNPQQGDADNEGFFAAWCC